MINFCTYQFLDLRVARGFYKQICLIPGSECKLTQHRWKHKILLPSAMFSSQENACRDYFLGGTIHLNKLQVQNHR